MLVLTRKLMEKLYIGGDICITVVRLEGSQVRLGIEAPREIPVVRAELKRHPRPASSRVAEGLAHELAIGLDAIREPRPLPDASTDAARGWPIGREARPQPIRLRSTPCAAAPEAVAASQDCTRSDSRNR